MSNFEIQNNEIAKELRKLLNLKSDVNLHSIARTAYLHFEQQSISISFRNTNKYNMVSLTPRQVLVATLGAQQCPRMAALIINLINMAILNKTGIAFPGLNQIVDEKEINKIFLAALLSALRSS